MAAVCWSLAAAVFVAWMFVPAVEEQVLRTEIGYTGATALLVLMLGLLYRRSGEDRSRAIDGGGGGSRAQAAPTERAIAR